MPTSHARMRNSWAIASLSDCSGVALPVSILVAAFIAALSWMAALTKFDLNYAYPFMSLNFVLLLLLCNCLLNEPLNLTKTI